MTIATDVQPLAKMTPWVRCVWLFKGEVEDVQVGALGFFWHDRAVGNRVGTAAMAEGTFVADGGDAATSEGVITVRTR